MIAPMKRAFVLVAERERRNASRALRSLGILHLEALQGSGEAWEELKADRASLERAAGVLAEFEAKGTKTADAAPSPREALDLAEKANRLDDEARAGYERVAALSHEIERIRSWGDFDPALIKELAGKGLSLRLAELPAKKAAVLADKHDFITLSTAKGRARVAFLAAPGAELPEDAIEFVPAASSLAALEADLEAAKAGIAASRDGLAALAPSAPSLSAAMLHLDRDLTLEAVRSGMPSDGPVAWLSGWVPAADEARLKETAAKNSWGLVLDEPQADELPPSKVENPPAVRMIQPVLDFLGTVPNYREYDISGLFLFFFAFFFAMIFGDGGYGSILLVAGIALALKAKASGKRVPDGIRLLLVLSGATVAWGILTLSWFGLPPEKLPAFLSMVDLPWLSSVNPESGDNVKVLCFSIGLVQLLVAHVKNIKRDFPSPKLIAQVGQFLMVLGMYFLVLNLVISTVKYPIPMWALYMVGGGFLLNFCFAGWESGHGIVKGFFKSIVASLVNIVSVFLGVVNVFADIVSYIRLWAVGLAGVAISQTVNNMAGPMLGHLTLFLAGVLLVVLGHGLNVLMSVLSVIVHGVRLNMLEFSGHLGMEWSGYKYEPFRDTVRQERAEDERSLT